MPSRSLLLAGLVPLIALLYAQFFNPSLLDFLRSKNAPVLPRSKTPIVMASTPAFSHIEKITTMAEGLIKLGYPVHFLSNPDFKDAIESIGAIHVPIEGAGPGYMEPEKMAHFVTLTGHESNIFAFKTIFTDSIPAQHRTLQRLFKSIREEYGAEQPLIYMNDFSFGGMTPVFLGAEGIRPDAIIGIAVAPYPAASNDTFPFQSGRHPDTSPSSREIHFKAQQERYESYPDKEVTAYLRKTLADMGAKKYFPSLYDMFASASDVLLQYGVPEFEYPRSDWRKNVKFVGAPVGVGVAERKLPEWWNEVVAAKAAGKKIVAVTSSSVVFENTALILPALEALKDREDVFVMATLVTSEAGGFDVPKNARVEKFIPVDLALPYVDVLITNGGYGTIQQGLRAGVPMIVSGVGQDKSHTGGIINYVGVGIYNAVYKTNPKMIADSFDEILNNASYRETSKRLAKEYEKYDAVEIADETIQQVLRGEYKVEKWN
ncbi:hypothetical protein HBI51_029340 [Parastagonospora nodorum]|nr:hypothetical protein HBI27_071620 [Parastagonospora nodorum]KAH5656861.1 hypothetical protein HBI51_029340 [Parastagonospora nodorum]KAH6105425.1 hypothetical protein HBI69_184950 [Parastagonospora nodorum]